MLEDKNKYINIPNFLTLLRFLMIGVMVWFFLNDHPIYAMIVFIVAVLTDFLDGYIARKFNQVTNIGKLLDPLADKLLQIAALFCMFWVDYLPLVAFILVVLCEVLMVYGASFLFLHKHTIVAANTFGKIAAGIMYGAILATFLHDFTEPFDRYAIYLAISIIYISMAQYWFITMRNRKRQANEKDSH